MVKDTNYPCGFFLATSAAFDEGYARGFTDCESVMKVMKPKKRMATVGTNIPTGKKRGRPPGAKNRVSIT